MRPAPDLTIVLVVRGAAPPIAATIGSILAQSAVSLELLIVDDGASGGIDEVVASIADERLRLIRLPAPGGNPRCWNRALEASRSPYLMVVDAGDRLLGTALVEMVGALERDPAAGLAHARWFPVDESGRIRLEAFREHVGRVRSRFPDDLDHRRTLLVDGIVIQALPTWRREVVIALGGFEESRGDTAGYAMALRVLDRGQIRLVPKFLCCRPAATPRPERFWARRIAISRALRDAGSAGFLEAEPYRLSRLALAGLLRLDRIRRVVGRTRWRIRRRLRQVAPLQLIRQGLGSGAHYEWLVDRMAWWPAGRSRPAPRGDAPVRIAYVLWRYPLLSETFIRREIHALRQAGVAVEVIADSAGEREAENHPAAPAGEAAYLEPIDGTRVRQLTQGFLRSHPLRLLNLLLYTLCHRYARRKSPTGDVLLLRKAVYLAGMLRDRGATRVHSPWADQHAFLALLAARLLGIPYSVQARAHEIHRRMEAFGLADKLRNAEFVITNSGFNAAHLLPLLGDRAASRLHTIYNGLDLTQFAPPDRSGVRHDPPRLLAVGRLVEQKGFDYLLQACAILRDRGVAFGCDIIGGRQVPEDTITSIGLGKLHRRLGLGEQVRFLGELPFSGILHAYRCADVFVLPCVIAADGGSDVTPNVLIEAMAMGLPVVSTPIAAIPEIVDAETSGVLVPPRDPVALADALARLLADAGLRARLGIAARKRIEERFDIARNIGRYVSLFTGPVSV